MEGMSYTLEILCYGTIKVNDNRRICGKKQILRPELETAVPAHKPVLKLQQVNFQEPVECNNHIVQSGEHKALVTF
jgi:hypothetical protein